MPLFNRTPNVDKMKKQRDLPGLLDALLYHDAGDPGRGEAVRAAAAQALGALGDKRAVEALVAALDEPSCKIKRAVASALGDLGDPRAFDALCSAFRCQDFLVRIDAARALGRLGDARAAPLLASALQDEHPYVRDAAELALQQINTQQAL